MAIVCKSEEFVSQPTIQSAFDDLWFGMIGKFGILDVKVQNCLILFLKLFLLKSNIIN